ncbi:MAG: protease-4 [Saprospiraceae bacterium]|jgi:protease-4
MKNFLKIIFGSCLGVIFAFVAVIFIGGAIGSAVASNANNGKEVKSNSVLHLQLDKAIPEQTGNVEMNFAAFSTEKTLGLHDIVSSIDAAREDDKIKGIYLDITSMSIGSASASVIRNAIQEFKDSGKFVLAYSKSYTQGGYYMASVADKVYVNPMGGVDFRGYGANISFFKEMLDEVGVKMEVFKVGKFKGAVEPFILNELSDANRLQIRQYINGLWDITKQDIGASRGKTTAQLEAIANEYGAFKAEGALSTGLVDAIGYEDELLLDMSTRLGLEEDKKLRLITPQDYFPSTKEESDYSIKDKVAVVFAEGSIVDGEGENAQIGDKKYVEIFRKLRKDKKVKAIVVRINSGGGSAMASENMWRELELCRAAGKPVIASMSDVAASGGYYMACASDSIFAEANTITGSIGVFGLFPITKELMNEKLHINFDSVKTSKFAASFSPTQEMTEEEKAIFQASTEDIYETFMTRVKDARGYPSLDAVNEIAQGRVWTGTKALEIGLIDRFGGLQDAIGAAASMAGLDEYRTSEYPKQKEPLVKLIEELTGDKANISEKVVKAELGEYYQYYNQLKTWKEMKGVQAKMPFNIEIR